MEGRGAEVQLEGSGGVRKDGEGGREERQMEPPLTSFSKQRRNKRSSQTLLSRLLGPF